MEQEFYFNMKDLIKEIYSNLIKTNGVITTKHCYINNVNRKLLEHGYDYYLHEDSNTLFYYWWDMISIKKELKNKFNITEFENELKIFFEQNYNLKVSKVKALYVGTEETKENKTY